MTPVFPAPHSQRSRVHKTANVLDMLLKGLHVDEFEVVLKITKPDTSTRPETRFVFNARDHDFYNQIKIEFDGDWPDCEEILNGDRNWVARSGSSMPIPSNTDDLWVRIFTFKDPDNGDTPTVKIAAKIDNTGEPDWSTVTPQITSTDFADMTGGRIGFKGGGYNPRIRWMRVKSHPDSNQVYQVTEHIDDFDLTDDYTSGGISSLGGGDGVDQPTYDDAGNMTYDGNYAYTFDAWNRLVQVHKAYRSPSGTNATPGIGPGPVTKGSLLQTSTYDGLSRRISHTVENAGDLDMVWHDYYLGQSIIEQRDGSDNTIRQFVWANLASGYIDELVQIAINDDPADGTEDDVELHYWAMQDVNFNIMGLVDSSGGLVERYEYSTYGSRQVFTRAGNGTNDPLALTARGLAPRVQLTAGIDEAYSINPFGHQGLYHDEHLGPDAIQNRARYRRSFGFLQRDTHPGTHYPDGMNTYAAYHVMHQGVDPMGLLTWFDLKSPTSMLPYTGDEGYYEYYWHMIDSWDSPGRDIDHLMYGTDPGPCNQDNVGAWHDYLVWTGEQRTEGPSRTAKPFDNDGVFTIGTKVLGLPTRYVAYHIEKELEKGTMRCRCIDQKPPIYIWVITESKTYWIKEKTRHETQELRRRWRPLYRPFYPGTIIA